MTPHLAGEVLLRHKEVLARVRVSKVTLWRMRADGAFPEPVKVSQRSVRWRQSDVDAWMASLHTAKAA